MPVGNTLSDSLRTARTFPNLTHLHLVFGIASVRPHSRDAFAEVLGAYPLPALKALVVEMNISVQDINLDGNTDRPVGTGPSGVSFDSLSSALRAVSENLTRFHGQGMVDCSLFDPERTGSSALMPVWPNMKSIFLDIRRPSGLRLQPAFAKDLHAGFARAAEQMPLLEDARLNCTTLTSRGGPFACHLKHGLRVSYYAPGISSQTMHGSHEMWGMWGREALGLPSYRRVFYHAARNWVSFSVRESFRRVGRERHGAGFVAYFLQQVPVPVPEEIIMRARAGLGYQDPR